MGVQLKLANLLLASLVAVSISGAASAAGKKPKPSFPADPKEVIAIYNGNTWTWSKGGSYWGNGGKFEAIWGDAIGIGKWYVTTKGTLCYEAIWYETNGSKSKPLKRCWEHVKDAEGVYYQQSTDPKDRKKWGWVKNTKVSKGNGIKSELKKLKQKAGL